MSFRSKPLGPAAPQQRRRAMDYPIISHGFRFNLAASAAGQQGAQNEEAEGIRADIAPSTDPPSTPAKQRTAEEKGNGLRSSCRPPQGSGAARLRSALGCQQLPAAGGHSSTASDGLRGARKGTATAVVAADAAQSASAERGAPGCWSSLEDKRPV